MKRFLHILLTILFIFTLVAGIPTAALASAEDSEHALEMEVNGYHVTLDSQNEWKKGENTLVVQLMDSMGMPVQNADVEVVISSKADGHSATDTAHNDSQQHDSMPGMDMGEPAEVMPAHSEATAESIAMMEADEHGMYMAQTHFESSGEHEVNVMFHVNGEMLQATFVVDILRSLSKSLVLWSFVAVNVVLILSAGLLKNQVVAVKGH
jgi:hypothetical protein